MESFKFGNGKWAVKEDYALAYNDENGNFKPLPFDFNRDSIGTRVNREGLIEVVPSGRPRIDFTDNTGGHLLLEPLRRNLATDSNLSLLSGGSSGSMTITGDGASNDVTLSNGLTGKRLTVDSSGRVYLNISCTVVSGTQYTISIYAENYSGAEQSNFVDILSGGGGEDFSSSLIENGRIQGTFTATSTTVVIRIGHGTTSTKTGYYSVDISGVQLEDSGSGSDATYATSLIPTSGSIVTRSAETANGAGNSAVFNAVEGVLFAEIQGLNDTDTSNRYISLTDGTVTNALMIQYRNSGELRLYNGGTSTAQMIYRDANADLTENIKVAIKYGTTTGSYKVYINGFSETIEGAFVATAMSGLNQLRFEYATGSNNFYGNIKDLRVYNTALTDSELKALTS